MSNRTADGVAAIRGHAVRMRRFVTALAIVCGTLVLLERFSAVTIAVVSTRFASASLRAFACHAVSAFPELLFVRALWRIRDALAAVSRGDLFARSMTTMLERVGVLVACGAAARILIVPGLCRLLGFNAGYWIAFDAASLVLAAIGLALRAIAGVLRHASTIQSELDEIF